MLDLMWAGEFPSRWPYASFQGMILFKTIKMSDLTLGSALSLMVIAAVVCGTKSMQTPSSTPSDRIASSISLVMSMNSVLEPVLTVRVFFTASPDKKETLRHSKASFSDVRIVSQNQNSCLRHIRSVLADRPSYMRLYQGRMETAHRCASACNR